MKSIKVIILKIIVDVTIVMFCFALLNLAYKNDLLSDKSYLLENNPIIYFAGDSRAFWQLRPDTASAYLGMDKAKIANIARTAGHPIEVENMIKDQPDKFKNSIIIISVSAQLLNKNAKSPNHYSKDLIAKRNIIEQLFLFSPDNLLSLQKYYYHVVLSYFNTTNEKSYQITNGHMPLFTNINYDKLNYEVLSNDPWYKNYIIDTTRVQEVASSLSYIRNNCKGLIVFNAPFSNAFSSRHRNTRLFEIEISFDEEMKRICAGNGIRYISYLNDREIKDDYFADWAHLNVSGSEIFTIKLLSDIGLGYQ